MALCQVCTSVAGESENISFETKRFQQQIHCISDNLTACTRCVEHAKMEESMLQPFAMVSSHWYFLFFSSWYPQVVS